MLFSFSIVSELSSILPTPSGSSFVCGNISSIFSLVFFGKAKSPIAAINISWNIIML